MARAETFLDDKTIEVEIVTDPTVYGLCKVKTKEGKFLARHVDRLEPLDDEARAIVHKFRWTPYKGFKDGV